MRLVDKHLKGWKSALSALGMLIAVAHPAFAATSEPFVSKPLNATLIAAQDGVPPKAGTLSAGLEVTLGDGWKTYWRSPGEVGIPPQIDRVDSINVSNVEMLWPAPERFTAFGIENFGYHGNVVFPLRITLDQPGEPARLNAAVNLLACSEICVPLSFDLELALPTGSRIDTASASQLSKFLAQVPVEGEMTGVHTARASVDEIKNVLTLEIEGAGAFDKPDVFAELGPGTALGEPDIRLGRGGTQLWAQIPILSIDESSYHEPILTVTDGPARAFTLTPELVADAPAPPFRIDEIAPGLNQLAWIALAAFLGGVILNVMPCVLPVLSLKLSSAIKAHRRDPQSVRTGFLVAAAGVMAFSWGLAACLYVLQLFGVAVGWGLQFQNPAFLAIMFLILALFAANLLGLFEFRLPAGLQTRLASAGGATGHGADFATGFFGAVLATPCSAPFLGTAIAFALAGRGLDILIVFTALGLGLAVPYLIVAAYPRAVKLLPRPGRWMLWLKASLGLFMLAPVTWLLWVLNSVAGNLAAGVVAALSVSTVMILTVGSSLPTSARVASISVLLLLPLVSAESLARRTPLQGQRATSAEQISWVAFDRGDIARRVSRGEVVFLDVTADWCLTCKANKALVLEREPVLSALNSAGIVAMQADWTRPDDRIARFLKANNRYGIPFYTVFGPASPTGIVLSEILSAQDVLNAIDNAQNLNPSSSSAMIGQ